MSDRIAPEPGDIPSAALPADSKSDIKQDLITLLPELRAYARFLLREPTRSDDLVHDAVVRALANLNQFQTGTSLRAWLFTILRNAFLEQTRRRKREAAAMLDHAAMQGDDLAPDAGGIADMSRMLWTLPPLLREALVLVGAQELTHEEAALICGVPAGTMRARVSRARTQLSKAFAAR